MLKQQARLVSAAMRLVDLALLAGAFPVAYLVRDGLKGGKVPGLYDLSFYWPVAATSLLLWLGASAVTQAYAAYRTRGVGAEIGRLARAMALVGLAMAAAGFISKQTDVSRTLLAIYCVVGWSFMAVTRVAVRAVARAARRRGYNTRTFAVVGSGEEARAVVSAILSHPSWGYVFAGHVLEEGDPPPAPGTAAGPLLGRLADLGALLERHVLDEVVFAVPRERLDQIENAMLACEEQGVGVKLCLHFFPRRIARLELEDLEGVPVLAFNTVPDDSLALVVKRAFDIAVSAVALVVGAPLFAILSLAIRLDSPGPVLFRQRRVGRNGRAFTLYKFRSMYADAEARLVDLAPRNEVDGPVFKMRDDPRVTRVGRFLRKTSLDELPQFWNVMRGEMSVVGPRPPLPGEVKRYERWQRRRLSVKPGITCTWQVSGRSHLDFAQWMELDLHYIDTWSLWGDLTIFLRTIPAVLWGRGAH